MIAYLEGKVAKWQLPKGVVWIDEVPKTSVGKFSKKTLRDEFADAADGRADDSVRCVAAVAASRRARAIGRR